VKPLDATRGTLRFRGTPVEEHWLNNVITVVVGWLSDLLVATNFLRAVWWQLINSLFVNFVLNITSNYVCIMLCLKR